MEQVMDSVVIRPDAGVINIPAWYSAGYSVFAGTETVWGVLNAKGVPRK